MDKEYSALAYTIGENLYLNLTNRCTNQCIFCIRSKCQQLNQKFPLWLEHEPSEQELLAAIKNPALYKQVVFCGYGEPLIRLQTVINIAKELKKNQTTIRLNTNGQANLFWGRNILPELIGLIDFISISLNSSQAEKYEKICCPAFGKQAFPAVVEFIKEAKKYIPNVEISIINLPGIDIAECEQMAKNLGISLRVRSYYEETYMR
jgi:TatD family-associated radical SAM protein